MDNFKIILEMKADLFKTKVKDDQRSHTSVSYTHLDVYKRQHMHRHGGDFSLSQITMDDVDLPRRMKGGEYVHTYYAYDVVSQCRIGLAYGRDKDDALVVDCFRDMFPWASCGWAGAS